MKLVVNASPLILLSAAGELSLLRELATEVVVPAEVLGELEVGQGLDDAAVSIRATAWMAHGDPLAIDPAVTAWDLGLGETAVLSWARAKNDFTCVLDDRAARNCARVMGLSCVGTLGVVLAAKEAGRLAAARPVLDKMMRAGFYLSDNILEKSLRGVGE